MLYLEDLAVGATFRTGRATITEQDIYAFARQFDPQPFHLDPEQAKASLFGRLVASGWHTMAVTMRLLVEGPLEPANGMIGIGVDGIQWPRPVLPDDQIYVISEILDIRPSQSRPDRGVVKVRNITFNQHDQTVQVMVANLVVVRRSEG